MKDEIDYSLFEKLDIRTAKIVKVEEIDGADKLYKLTLDVGELGERIVCAGVKKYYSIKDLKGKQVIYLAKLKSRMLKGVESRGMILAASNKDSELLQEGVILLSVGKEAGEGWSVS